MKKILIVDDEISIVELLTMSLRLKGYEVIHAFDGTQALQQAFQHAPDLIILDIMLPGESGFTVYEKLKKSILTEKIPIIFLTAISEEQFRQHAPDLKEKEMVIFKKPWDVKELMISIEKALSKAAESGH